MDGFTGQDRERLITLVNEVKNIKERLTEGHAKMGEQNGDIKDHGLKLQNIDDRLKIQETRKCPAVPSSGKMLLRITGIMIALLGLFFAALKNF